MGAALLMPAFGVAVDQLARIATPALWAGRLVLIGATAMNLSALHSNGNDWANKAIAERNILELVAASPLTRRGGPDDRSAVSREPRCSPHRPARARRRRCDSSTTGVDA